MTFGNNWMYWVLHIWWNRNETTLRQNVATHFDSPDRQENPLPLPPTDMMVGTRTYVILLGRWWGTFLLYFEHQQFRLYNCKHKRYILQQLTEKDKCTPIGYFYWAKKLCHLFHVYQDIRLALSTRKMKCFPSSICLVMDPSCVMMIFLLSCSANNC